MPLVSVSEVVRFAAPAGARVLAGAAGMANTVQWARVLRARPATIASVEQGEVWLLSSAAVQQAGEPRALARLVREVAGAGVVAFMVTAPLPEDVRAEADRSALPVVLLPPESSLAEVEKAILDFVVDRDRAIAQRVQEVFDRLLATLVEDHGSELLAGIVNSVTGKAIYLLDEHLQATVQAGGDDRTADALADIRRRFWDGHLDHASERLITFRGAGSVPASGAASVVAPAAHASPLAALMRPLTLRGAVEGYLALIGDANDFTDFDFQVADKTASVMAIELAKQSAIVEARLRVQGDFLEELLDTPVSTDQLSGRARALGYDLTRPHLVLVLRPRPNDGKALLPRQQQRFVDVARRRLVIENAATLVREREGGVQALLPSPTDIDAELVDDVTHWLDARRREIEALLAPDTIPIIVGVGRTPANGLTYHAALREATQAAEIAASMPEGASTLHFARLGSLRLIFHLAGTPELRAFQEDLIGALEDYDHSHRSELVQTLDAFFRAGGNHMEATRQLHVHRNTLIYRLERIQELLGGANLEDPDTRLNLQLALKIRWAFGPV
jgi:purine catabolism regulator